MSNSPIFKIPLMSRGIKVALYAFIVFVLLIGFGLTLLFFQNNFFMFISVTMLSFFSSLLVVSLIYTLTHRPDGTGNNSIRTYYIVVILLEAFSLILSWFMMLSKSLMVVILIAFPFILDIFGLILLSLLLIPEKTIEFNPQTNIISYIINYKTRIETKRVNLTDVLQISLGSKETRNEFKGSSVDIYFSFKIQNQFEWWKLQTYNSAEVLFRLLRILANYPIIVNVNSKQYLRPIKDLLHRPITPTRADFRFNDNDRIKAIFSDAGDNLIDYTLQAENLSPKKPFASLNEQNDNFSAEVIGRRVSSVNKFGALISLLLLGLTMFIIGVLILYILYFYFNQQSLAIFFKNNPSPDPAGELVPMLVLSVVVTLLASYIYVIGLFGRESLTFKEDLIIFTIKVFNKKIFNRIIPIKAVIGIECLKNNINLRILGGDFLAYWHGELEDQPAMLRQLATYLY